jgi:hypothetical protein
MAKTTDKKKYQPSPKVLSCRENGRKGGLARVAKQTQAQRSAVAGMGGSKCAELHGDDFFAHIAKQKRFVGRYRKPTVLQLAIEAEQKKKRKKAA